ncbi:MAG: ABC transporter ATP-binding protein, partial [Tumebacillaceae bacterium]
DFPIGRKVAIVGASGSGKSTVAQLLVRLYDPMEGKVRINERSLQDYQKGDWLKRLSLVPQEPYFFPESIRTNLLLGRENISEEQLRTACEIAQIQELIDELPEGLDTIIGERGISLSGGQRQRLAIARAILPEPDILLLDEGTSALDVETERLVQKALDEHRRGRTTIFIAHRLSTIENADLIYVMDHGSVVEAGTHAELMQGETKYRELFTAQVISA